jgi:hypothetical protein
VDLNDVIDGGPERLSGRGSQATWSSAC